LRVKKNQARSSAATEGCNTEETRIYEKNFEHEQTEKTEENAESLVSLLSPVKQISPNNFWHIDLRKTY
jgi:hypothetical protein